MPAICIALDWTSGGVKRVGASVYYGDSFVFLSTKQRRTREKPNISRFLTTFIFAQTIHR